MRRSSVPAWFKGYLLRYKRAVAVALALGLVASACAALLMFTSGYLISATALAGTTLFSIMVPVACVQLFGFGRPLARYAERLASHDWVLRVTSDLRLALFGAAEERTGDPARERALGDYLGLLSDDVAHLQNLYLRVVFPTAVAYLLAIGASLAFGFFSVPFASVVALALACVAALLPLCCLLLTRAGAERAKALKAGEYAALADDVYGAVDWVLAGRGDEAAARHASFDGDVRALEQRERFVVRTVSLAASVLLAVLSCAVIAWAGARFGEGGADVNWLAAFALGFFPLIESFVALPAAFAGSTSHREAVRRLDDMVAPEPAGDAAAGKRGGGGGVRAACLPGPVDGARSALDALSPRSEASGGAGRSAQSGAVSLSHVTYRYPGAAEPALEDVSLEFAAGQSVAVLGRSGAGKTTLARLLSGQLTPDEGTVRGCGPASVGFVGQVPYLFNRTLRDNLTLGVMEASDERLAEALESVGLAGKLAALPQGLDTVVGETGTGLSGGEAHRVAIARVLVADAPVVVVDEPFNALDPDTERALLETLLSTCGDRTLVVITHHLAQIERFDRVVFIEGARVADDAGARLRELIEFDRGLQSAGDGWIHPA